MSTVQESKGQFMKIQHLSHEMKDREGIVTSKALNRRFFFLHCGGLPVWSECNVCLMLLKTECRQPSQIACQTFLESDFQVEWRLSRAPWFHWTAWLHPWPGSKSFRVESRLTCTSGRSPVCWSASKSAASGAGTETSHAVVVVVVLVASSFLSYRPISNRFGRRWRLFFGVE